jgi:hypothetical protein
MNARRHVTPPHVQRERAFMVTSALVARSRDWLCTIGDATGVRFFVGNSLDSARRAVEQAYSLDTKLADFAPAAPDGAEVRLLRLNGVMTFALGGSAVEIRRRDEAALRDSLRSSMAVVSYLRRRGASLVAAEHLAELERWLIEGDWRSVPLDAAFVARYPQLDYSA